MNRCWSFFSIKVPDGPLTSRLQRIKRGDIVLVGRKATGTLITDNLLPGSRLMLFFFPPGQALAPFASRHQKTPDVYERYQSIVLVHGCRQISELSYRRAAGRRLRSNELFWGRCSRISCTYYPHR